MRAAKLLFICLFLNSGVLFSNQLTSLEQLISQTAAEHFAKYLKAIGKRNLQTVKNLIGAIYDKSSSIFQRKYAAWQLNDILNSIQPATGLEFDCSILEIQRLLTARQLELIKEEEALSEESKRLPDEQVKKILKTTSEAEGFTFL